MGPAVLLCFLKIFVPVNYMAKYYILFPGLVDVVLYTATNVAGISFAWPSSLEPQHSSFMFPFSYQII